MNQHSYKNILSIVGAITLLAGAFYGFDQYIESKINKAVTKPVIINEISRIVRPSVFFDANGSILKEAGGMSFIEKIEITDSKSIGTAKIKFPTEIKIVPKKHLDFPPVIQSVGYFQFIARSKRDKGFIWLYNLELTVHEAEIKNYIFRLEIIQ